MIFLSPSRIPIATPHHLVDGHAAGNAARGLLNLQGITAILSWIQTDLSWRLQDAKKRTAVDTTFKQYTVKMKKPMGLTFEEVEGEAKVRSLALSDILPHVLLPVLVLAIQTHPACRSAIFLMAH